MKKFNYILVLFASVLVGLSTVSCEDYLDVNRNEDAPDYVDAYLYLAGIQQNYQGLYWDIRALGPLTQMMGTSSYGNFANHYYSAGSDAAGEIWRMVYWNQGMNLENMINQSLEAENWTLAGIGYAMKAFSWDAMTKYHGDLPMKQAFVPGLLSHEYDYQEEIYPQILEWAKLAIEYLQKEDNTNYGTKITSNDFIYGGDKQKWIKFAYAVIVRNLASLSHKNNFKSEYYPQLVEAASKAFQSNDDNATLTIGGGGASAAYSSYNNFWCPFRGNLARSYWPHEYAVEIMTGRVPKYDDTGNWIQAEDYENKYLRYEIADEQIICDTTDAVGHFDPRPLAKLTTSSGCKAYILSVKVPTEEEYAALTQEEKDSVDRVVINDGRRIFATSIGEALTKAKSITGATTLENSNLTLRVNEKDLNRLKKFVFFGGTFTGTVSSFLNNEVADPQQAKNSSVANFYDMPYTITSVSEVTAGTGRWLYREDAPYILTTYSEILFDLAEAQFIAGDKGAALETWKKAVAADLEFTAKYIVAPTCTESEAYHFGDIVDAADFNTLAQQYINGPYVNGMTLDKFSMSHIMMQKFVALYPWGAGEVWVDQRKNFYDIQFSGEVPAEGNGYDLNTLNQKVDTDPTKVYKGFYLMPAQVQGRKSAYNKYNHGSPCFRVRPRYNSEYMWNKPSLDKLAPYSGMTNRYITSIPWFAYPGDQPKTQVWTTADE